MLNGVMCVRRRMLTAVAVALTALVLGGCQGVERKPATPRAAAADASLTEPSLREGRIAVMALQDEWSKGSMASPGEELFFDAVPIHATQSRGVVRVWVAANALRISPAEMRKWAESEEFGTLNANDDVEIPAGAVQFVPVSGLYWVTVRRAASGMTETRVSPNMDTPADSLPTPLDTAWRTPALDAVRAQSFSRVVLAARARAAELAAATD